MRRIVALLVVLLSLPIAAAAQSPMSPRANMVAYDDDGGIEKLAYRESPYFMELTGSWKQRRTDTSIIYTRQIEADRIWKDYLAYFVTHPIHLIIGNGIGSEPLHGPAHNTLIDFLYYYGLIGTILFFRIIVRSVPRHQPITIMNGCVLLGMLFMSMSLSYLEAYDFGLLMSFGICYLLMGNHAGASVSSKIEDHLAQGEAYANQRDYSSI